MYFKEALKNDSEFNIQLFVGDSTKEMHEYLNPFVSTKTPGLHVLIMCLPPDAPQPNEDLIKKALSHPDDPCEPLPHSEETIPLNCTKRYFIVSSTLDSYEAALREVSGYARRCYNRENMFSDAIRYSREDLLEKTIARQLQNQLQEALDGAEGHCHTLFAFLILPKIFYEEIKEGGKNLPSFIEYIVLCGGAQEAIQKLEEQSKENKELKEEKKKLEAENKKREETNVELTKRIKASDDGLIVLLSYLHSGLINGSIAVYEQDALKKVLDTIKQIPDSPSELRRQIDEMVSFINSEKTGTRIKTLLRPN